MWNFFEQPWTLLGAAVIVLLGVLTYRSVWFEKRKGWQWLLPAGVALLAVGLDLAVATDPEKINGILKAGIAAAEHEDCRAIARLLAPNYEDSFHKGKQALVEHCRARLVPPAVERVRKIARALEITPPTATATLTLGVRFEKDSYWARSYKPGAIVKARFWLRKQADKSWLVTRIEVLEVDGMTIGWRDA
jgi:hypothetical protein